VFASYQLESGLGASLGVVGMSEQNLDVLGRVKIPAQFTANGALFYRRPRYELRLDFYNLTDEKNFSQLFRNGFFGAELVMPEPPFSMLASVRARF
jgi:outer membrane receptor protein involved in Fe transport